MSAAAFAASEAAARAARAARSGLVSDTTSRTAFGKQGGEGSPPPEFNTRTARYRRMRYNVIASSTMIDADARRGGFRIDCIFVTLTYRDGVVDPETGEFTAGQPMPKHVSEYTHCLRSWCARREIAARFVWVAEMQPGRAFKGQPCALHYHLIVWLPHGYRLPMPDKAGWWKHGSSKIERARSPVGYLAHYAGKLKTKGGDVGLSMPRGFKLYGCGGLTIEQRLFRAWANFPGWLRDRVQPEDRCKRIVGGGFFSRERWEHWPSPWRIGRVRPVGGGAIVTLLPAFSEGVELCSPW
jgi:hypothetical protein